MPTPGSGAVPPGAYSEGRRRSRGEHAISKQGDFVRVAICETPTEAHIIRGVLRSAGLAAHVADANIVQANAWMTQAVGGVRVMVPESQVSAAQEAIAEYNAGLFDLDTEPAQATDLPELPVPLFSPDRALVLGFLLTPVFAPAVQLANARMLGQSITQPGRWVWLLLLAGASVVGVHEMHQIEPGPFVVFQASLSMGFLSLVWYFFAGQEQSRELLATYGVRFKRRSLVKPALALSALYLAFGWTLSELM